MATRFTDNFNGSAGDLLYQRTSSDGGTWSMASGFSTAVTPVISDAGRARGGASGGSVCVSSGVATADTEIAEATVQTISTAAGFGIMARAHVNLSGSPRGYMAYYSNSSGLWKVMRLDNSSTFTQIGSSATQALSVGSHTILVTVSGTGATVTIELKVDGSTVLSVSDTNASRITTFGSAALYFDTTFSNAAGTHVGDLTYSDSAASSTVTSVTVSPSTPTVAGGATEAFTATVNGTGSPSQSVTWSASAGSIDSGGVFTAPAATGSSQSVTITATSVQDNTKSGTATATVPAADSMAVTAPVDGKIYPLSSGATGTASLTFSGTYTGSAPDQWQVVLDSDHTTPVAVDGGSGWQSFTSAPAAGTFSQAITGLPKLAGWYNVRIRNSGTPATIARSGKIGAGALIACDGQSRMWLFFSTTAYAGDSSLTPNALLRVAGKQSSSVNSSWDIPATATMNGAIALGNALVSGLGCPVGLIDGSWDGSGLTMTGNGGNWISGGGAGNAYTSSAAAISALTTKVLANIWIQGEGDAGASVSQSAYYTALGQLIALRRAAVSDASLPYILVTLARNTAGMSDAARENIKAAQIQKCADANIYRVDSHDLPLHSDGVHHTAAGFTTLGARVARAILASLGLVSTYRGPRITSVNTVSSTVYDVTLTHDMGSDFTPTSGITGFRVLDGSTPATISSAVRQSANVIRLTLSGAPAGAVTVQHLYGSAPTITSITKDNSSATMPLEYNGGVVAAASSVSGVTVSPSSASVTGGATQAFTATVAGTGSPSQSVTWSASAGAIDSSGVFTAPATTASAQTVTVTATSVQDGTKSGTATVTVPAARRATVTLTTDGSTPAASQSGIRWAWWESALSPALSQAPAASGTNATTSAAGVFDVPLVGSTLTAGQVGFLVAVITDGTPGSAACKAFAGPVTVS